MVDPIDLCRCVWLVVATGLTYAAVLLRRVVLRLRHPLDWPVDLEMLAAGFKVGIRWGNLATLRLTLGWMAHPALFPRLRVRQVQPPGCEPCYWLSLRSGPQDSAQPDIVLCYVHGGAFVAGHPLMCAATFGRWMRALASQGLHTKVLCISYPLAPERPFPAAVASTAAAFAWVGQAFPAGCGTTVIALGDSAGGNIVPAALHALRDYCQQPQPAARLHTQGASSGVAESAPAGEGGSRGTPAASHQPSALIRSNSQAAALTAALEAHLFADLHNRLTVMAVKSMQASASSDAGPAAAAAAAAAAAVPACAVRMPSAIILVSPAADISPTACFRSRSLTSSSSSSPTDADSTGITPSSRVHYDYLPENIESGGMGSYAEHHEQLCGVYASLVHLPQLDGLCSGRWLVLSGGVELLHADIERFASKLQRTLGPQQVLFYVEPLLPHSWAILPTPSMASRQDVVVSFIAAEHAAAAAAAERPGAVMAGPSTPMDSAASCQPAGCSRFVSS